MTNDIYNLFEPEDFKIITPGQEFRIRDCGIAADFANQILRKYIEREEIIGQSEVIGGKIIFTKKAVYRVYEKEGEIVCTEKPKTVEYPGGAY